MEYSCMADKILRLIEKILHRNPNLIDFTIIPTEENTENRSPVILQENHLGLESWCIKYIYQHSCHELFEVRKQLSERKLAYYKMENLNYLLIGALFVNPDMGTFWNMKRELVEMDILNYSDELKFSQLVLTKKSKSYEAFSYRKWLLTRVIDKMKRNNIEISSTFLETELQTTLQAAEGAKNNYHAWNHRIWAIENLSNFSQDVLENELAFCKRWILGHVSENSGYHYRQYLINSVKNHLTESVLQQYYLKVLQKLDIISDLDPTDFRPFLNYLLGSNHTSFNHAKNVSFVNYIVLLLYELLISIDKINHNFIDHETLWCHRRYVVFSLLKCGYEYEGLEFTLSKNLDNICFKNVNSNIIQEVETGERFPKILKIQPLKIEMSHLWNIILDSERNFVLKNRNSNSQVQIELSKRHQKWLKFMLNIDL